MLEKCFLENSHPSAGYAKFMWRISIVNSGSNDDAADMQRMNDPIANSNRTNFLIATRHAWWARETFYIANAKLTIVSDHGIR